MPKGKLTRSLFKENYDNDYLKHSDISEINFNTRRGWQTVCNFFKNINSQDSFIIEAKEIANLDLKKVTKSQKAKLINYFIANVNEI